MRLIFDSHLDLAWNALSYNRDQTETVDEINSREAGMDPAGGRGHATTSLPEMGRPRRRVPGNTAGCGPNVHVQPAAGHRRTDLDYGTQSIAYAMAQGQLAYYRLLRRWRNADDRHVAASWTNIGGTGKRIPRAGCRSATSWRWRGDPIVDPGQVEAWYCSRPAQRHAFALWASHYSVGTGTMVR